MIVTGATSFIGIYLVDKLLAYGDEVFAVLRPNSENKARFTKQFGNYLHIIQADMDEYGELAKRIPMGDVFIHLSWNGTRGEQRQNPNIQKNNYRCSLNALQSAIQMGVTSFISAGSQAEYGQQRGVVKETDPSVPFSEYGKYKWRFYQEAVPQCRQYGINLYEPRFFSLYGKGDYPGTMVISTIDKMLKNLECSFTDCQQMWNYLHVRDAVEGMIHLFYAHLPAGIYNCGSLDTRRLRGYIEEMAELTHTKSILRFGIIPHNDSGRDGIQPNIEKLLATGWRPKITFAEGVHEIIQTLSVAE